MGTLVKQLLHIKKCHLNLPLEVVFGTDVAPGRATGRAVALAVGAFTTEGTGLRIPGLTTLSCLIFLNDSS